jgi:hypothetical protein
VVWWGTRWRGQALFIWVAEAGYFWARAARADTVCRAWRGLNFGTGRGA